MLLAAFAISLLLHLIWAVLVYRALPPIESQVETVTIRHSLTLSKMATPPPQPKHTPVPHPVATSRPLPKATRASQTTGSTGGTAHATAAPTVAPTPAATVAANACAKSDIDAVVLSTPDPPDIPIAARADGTSGTTLVAVKLDAQGTVTGASVAQSSGNSSLDVIALGMARDARYAPATHDCKAIASTYTFSVKFAAW